MAKSKAPIPKPLLLAVVVMAFVVLYWLSGGQLTLENFAKHENALREYERANPLIVLTIAFVLYVAVSGLSIPGGAVVLSLAYGSYFGWLKAVMLVSFASTAGATIAFLISRYLFRDMLSNRFGDRLASFNKKLDDEGAFYLFTLRLIPAVPFFMINLVMGLTSLKASTFWWVSQIGMLPGTIAYIYAGSTLKPSQLAEHGFKGLGWQFPVAFVILGFLPLLIKRTVNAMKRTRSN